jgi:hypothetical protein
MEIRLRQVECLNCGHRRAVREGWASSAELSERTRRLLRERPVARRHLRAV